MALNVDAARRAIEERCGRPLGLDVVAAAHGIVEIANAAMVNALRMVSIQHGFDPRDFVLIAFGGAGPGHANRLAIEMRFPLTIIPRAPGIFSAMGLLVTDLRHDFSLTRIRRVDTADPAELTKLFAGLATQGRAALEREGVPSKAMRFPRQVDMRYVGQSYEISVPLPEDEPQDRLVELIDERFHREHDRIYGFSAPTEPTELVNLRLSAIGTIAKPESPVIAAAGPDGAAAALQGYRPVYFVEAGGFVDCPIYLRYELGHGAGIDGPAVIEEMDSTTVVHPGFQVTVDTTGNLLLERQ
jgi:N-methylhydantoinase A